MLIYPIKICIPQSYIESVKTGKKSLKVKVQMKARAWTKDAYGKYYGSYSNVELSGKVGRKK